MLGLSVQESLLLLLVLVGRLLVGVAARAVAEVLRVGLQVRVVVGRRCGLRVGLHVRLVGRLLGHLHTLLSIGHFDLLGEGYQGLEP
jgi:hypothetical protein